MWPFSPARPAYDVRSRYHPGYGPPPSSYSYESRPRYPPIYSHPPSSVAQYPSRYCRRTQRPTLYPPLTSYPTYLSGVPSIADPDSILNIRPVKSSSRSPWETTPDGQFQIKRRRRRNTLTRGGSWSDNDHSTFRSLFSRRKNASRPTDDSRRGRQRKKDRSHKEWWESSSSSETMTGALRDRILRKIRGEKSSQVDERDAVYIASEQLLGSVGLTAATLVGDVMTGAKGWYNWAVGREEEDEDWTSSIVSKKRRNSVSKDRRRKRDKRKGKRSMKTGSSARSGRRGRFMRGNSRSETSRHNNDDEDEQGTEQSRRTASASDSEGWWAERKLRRRRQKSASTARTNSTGPSNTRQRSFETRHGRDDSSDGSRAWTIDESWNDGDSTPNRRSSRSSGRHRTRIPPPPELDDQ